MKIWLDYEILMKSLMELHSRYLKELDMKVQPEIRFSLIAEFQEDYVRFLDILWQRVSNTFGPEKLQKILSDFIGLRIESASEIRSILTTYNEIFDEHFPMFKGVISPVRLSIVGSNIKFPFFEVWRLLCEIQDSINIHLVDRGSIRLNVKDLDMFLRARMGSKTLLHKLVRLAEISPRLAEITLHDKADKDFKKYEDLRTAVRQFGFSNMLTYVKMLSEQE